MTKHTKNIILIIFIILIIGFFVYTKNNKQVIQQTNSKQITQQTHVQQDNKHLSWIDFQKKAQDKDSVVIDIRTKEETAQGKLFENAEEIDYYSSTFEQKIAQLDPSKTYLIYCRSGHRSANALPIFEKYNLKVYDLDGGHKATPVGSLK